MLIAITVPATNEKGPVYTQQFLAAVHQANTRRLPLSLRIAGIDKKVGLQCRFPDELQQTIKRQFVARYDDCRIEELSTDPLDPSAEQNDGLQIFTAELSLRPDVFPILRHPQFQDAVDRSAADPLSGLNAAIAPGDEHEPQTAIEITIRPARSRRVKVARCIIDRLNTPFFRSHRRLADAYALLTTSHLTFLRAVARTLGVFTPKTTPPHDPLSTSPSLLHDREDDLQAAADKVKRGRQLFETHIRLLAFAPLNGRPQAQAQLRELAAAFAQFNGLATFRFSRRSSRRGFLLSDHELATIWHPAIASVQTPQMARTEFRRLEPPTNLRLKKREGECLTELGSVTYQDRGDVFGLDLASRLRHLALIGKTGTGKSTLFENMIASDLRAGRGVAVIDPHGDLQERVLLSVPRDRTNDVIHFDAGDTEHPLAFNPLDLRSPEQRPLVASGVVSTLKKQHADSWGPRLENLLRFSLLALLEVPGTSLVSLLKMLSDDEYRKRIVGRVRDPAVFDFWTRDFASWNPRYRGEAVAPIQNKAGQLIAHPILRSILGQARGALDLRSVMDDGRILIINLSKGKIGEDGSTMLGSLLVTSLQLAAMSRADIPQQQRRPFCLYVDEFQNFATESFAEILSEARKYGLALTTANQFVDQMEKGVAAAVFGNIGSIVAFGCGARDADFLSEEFAGKVTAEDLIALPAFNAYTRLHETPHHPFSMATLPPPHVHPRTKRGEKIRRSSRRRYAKPAEKVEREIGRAFLTGRQTVVS